MLFFKEGPVKYHSKHDSGDERIGVKVTVTEDSCYGGTGRAESLSSKKFPRRKNIRVLGEDICFWDAIGNLQQFFFDPNL